MKLLIFFITTFLSLTLWVICRMLYATHRIESGSDIPTYEVYRKKFIKFLSISSNIVAMLFIISLILFIVNLFNNYILCK